MMMTPAIMAQNDETKQPAWPNGNSAFCGRDGDEFEVKFAKNANWGCLCDEAVLSIISRMCKNRLGVQFGPDPVVKLLLDDAVCSYEFTAPPKDRNKVEKCLNDGFKYFLQTPSYTPPYVECKYVLPHLTSQSDWSA